MEIDKKLNKSTYFIYGLGNFASQLSWTMVSAYLTLFYTDVFGLQAGAVAVLVLVAKLADGINDPAMGMIVERTHTKFGRFRPYIAIGAPLLVLSTILTFTVPDFGSTGKLIYAYVTYIGLGVTFTITNLPYTVMPMAMTRDPKEINRLNAAQMMGMTIGQIVLNLCTLTLIRIFGKGNQSAGYQTTAMVYALLSLPIYWFVVFKCKERVTRDKTKNPPVKEMIKLIRKNRNFLLAILYSFCSITSMMGRIAVALFYYLYCVKSYSFTTLFMMMQMIVGTIVMPFAPRVMDRLGKKKTAMLAVVIQSSTLLILFLGPSTNLLFVFICLVVYGMGYIAGPCGNGMIADSIETAEFKSGYRMEGMAFSIASLSNKLGTAIGNALGIAVIGWFGYQSGAEVTPVVQKGMNIAVNLIPAIMCLLGLVPLFFYNLTEEKMLEIRSALKNREKG